MLFCCQDGASLTLYEAKVASAKSSAKIKWQFEGQKPSIVVSRAKLIFYSPFGVILFSRGTAFLMLSILSDRKTAVPETITPSAALHSAQFSMTLPKRVEVVGRRE